MKTLILFLDAFSKTDFKEENCPFLYKLAKEGSYGPMDIIPSCYHTEYSMLSGCLPLKHKIWTWYITKKDSSFSKIKNIKFILNLFNNNEKFQRKIIDIYINLLRLFSGKTRFLKTNKIPLNLLKNFEVAVDKSYVDHNPLPVPTLFDLLRKNKISYCAMDYPTISNNRNTFFYLGKGDFLQLKKIEKKLKKYSVVYAHIWQLDAIEHKYGLHSKQALNHIKKLDFYLKNLFLRNKKNDLKIIIFSDHGGCEIKKTRNILPLIKDYSSLYFIGSTNAQVWLKDTKKLNELKNKIKKEGFLIYDKNNIEKELNIPYTREAVGDLMIAVKPGEQLYPDFFRDNDKVKSMHGYTQKSEELRGIFISHGFNSKTKNIKNMRLFDITPTILKLLNLKIPKIYDGKPRIE